MPRFLAPLSGGIDIGKFFDRITTVSCDASQEERALITAAPSFLGGLLDIAAPGAGSAIASGAGGLLHESECTVNRQRDAINAQIAEQKAATERFAKQLATAAAIGGAVLIGVLFLTK